MRTTVPIVLLGCGLAAQTVTSATKTPRQPFTGRQEKITESVAPAPVAAPVAPVAAPPAPQPVRHEPGARHVANQAAAAATADAIRAAFFRCDFVLFDQP